VWGEVQPLVYIYICVCVREREFYYSVYNQCELFICLDLIVKNREVPIIYMYIYICEFYYSVYNQCELFIYLDLND
jgi:hypothetical protein